MEFQTIQYHKVFNLGNYQNEKIGCEIKIGPGEDPVIAHKAAVEYVEKAHAFFSQIKSYNRAKQVAEDPMNHSGLQVQHAKTLIEDFEKNYADFIKAYGTMPALNSASDEEFPG